LAAVAARTFPLACPPSVALADLASFIDANLSDARFAEYLADPQRRIFTAAREGRIIGYAMLISGVSDDPDVQRAVDIRPAAEISKMYVLAAHHGSGAATALMTPHSRPAPNGVPAACGSVSIRKTNALNSFTSGAVSPSTERGASGWALTPKATTSWSGGWTRPKR